jgi:hypothetical protein
MANENSTIATPFGLLLRFIVISYGALPMLGTSRDGSMTSAATAPMAVDALSTLVWSPKIRATKGPSEYP